MSDLKIKRITTSKSYGGNDSQGDVTGTRDGALYTAQYVLKHAMEGRLYLASVGTATTPITFKTGFTAAQPELSVDVPAGVIIIPVSIQVYLEDSAGTDTEIVMQTAQTVTAAGTSTIITPANVRTRSGLTTACTVYSAYSGAGTTPTGTREFYRGGYAFADATGNPQKLWEYNIYKDCPQIIDGAGALLVYVGGTGTAPNGYIKASWMEFLSGEL